VSTYRQVASWWSWERDAALVPGAYLDLVTAACGQPVLLPPENDTAPAHPAAARAAAERLVGMLDALVLTGGGDVEADRYGQQADPHCTGANVARDELELALLDAAFDRDLPLLAICRGMQVLNVGLGGSLVQHLPERVGTILHQPRPGAFGEVAVTTAEGSEVRRVLGERLKVLCSHHQAVATLGERLVATAWSEDGVIEAVELPGHRFAVGVQWHPEESGDVRLFEALVTVARVRAGTAISDGTPVDGSLR
jgi:gamma-glutamyl-gamma-aminobutyrate hydrolase PuuD